MVDLVPRVTLNHMRNFFLPLLVLTAHCGGSVVTDPAPSSSTEPPPGQTAQPWVETPSCAVVAASCGSDPAVVVRGHASGFADLEGARAEFAVRYAPENGSVFEDPPNVAVGRTRVKDGAFETCVCVPHGANMYPQIAAVVYLPGTTGITSKDVARATFSQRYATLGDEDVTYACHAAPSVLQKESALAAMVERTASVRLRTAPPGVNVIGGLVADERPVAAQITGGYVEGTDVSLRWTMPGRAWSSERVAFFLDRNANGKCDAEDAGAFAPFAATIDAPTSWLEGAAITPVCDALRAGESRE